VEDFIKNNFSEKSISIINKKESLWEYSLMSQLIQEEVEFNKIALSQSQGVEIEPKLKFESIRNFNDLVDIHNLINNDKSDYQSISVNMIKPISPEANQAAFGPLGVRGNPFLLKIAAKRASVFCFELAIFSRKMESRLSKLDYFVNTNLSSRNTKWKLSCDALKAMMTWSLKNINYAVSFFEDQARIFKSFAENHRAGIAQKTQFPFNVGAIYYDEYLEIYNKASQYFIYEIKPDELRKKVKAETIAPNIKDKISTENSIDLKSPAAVIEYLSGLNCINKDYLRDILLPLGYFPDSFIDEINERSLDIAGEIAIESADVLIKINQEIFVKTIEAAGVIFK